jgi:hypothetical protein
VQLSEHKERGTKQARQHVKRFIVPPALRKVLAPLLPHQSQAHLEPPVDAGDLAADGDDNAHLGSRSARAAGAAGRAADAPGGDAAAAAAAAAPAAAAAVTGVSMQPRAAVPMQTVVMKERRLALLKAHVESAGFLLQNEVRYVWYTEVSKVRCRCC